MTRKRRSGEAVAAQHRKAGPMRHRLEPRGGATNPDWTEEKDGIDDHDQTFPDHERIPMVTILKAPDPFATEMVTRAAAHLRATAKTASYLAGVVTPLATELAADVNLQRAALMYACAKLAETGEHGTTDALTLLRQIAEGLV